MLRNDELKVRDDAVIGVDVEKLKADGKHFTGGWADHFQAKASRQPRRLWRREGSRTPHARFVITSATDAATALAIAAFQISLLSKDHEGMLSVIERAPSLNPSRAAALYFGALMESIAKVTEDARLLGLPE